jgi:hypothetical protein
LFDLLIVGVGTGGIKQDAVLLAYRSWLALPLLFGSLV